MCWLQCSTNPSARANSVAVRGSRKASYLSCVPEPVFDSTATAWHAVQSWGLICSCAAAQHAAQDLLACDVLHPYAPDRLRGLPTLNVVVGRHAGLEICLCCRRAFVRLSSTFLQGGGKLVNNRAMHSRNT